MNISMYSNMFISYCQNKVGTLPADVSDFCEIIAIENPHRRITGLDLYGHRASRKDFVLLQLALAETYAELGQMELAKKLYEEAIDRFPSETFAHQMYAIHLASIEKLSEADSELKSLVEIDPTGTLMGLDSLEEEDPVLEFILSNLGLLLIERGEIDRARSVYEKIVKANPDHAIAHNNLAILLNENFDEREKAREHYERALEIDPDYADAHVNLAILLTNNSDEHEGAREHYERALEIAPDHALAHINLALLLSNNSDEHEKAREHFERALETNPDDADVHYGLAVLLTEQFGQHEKARELFERALELDPDNVNAHNDLANLLIDFFDEHEGARKHYERALEIDPDDAETQSSLANLLENHFDQS
mgnify:CR=1 FL=1